jgi:hypothetical protein
MVCRANYADGIRELSRTLQLDCSLGWWPDCAFTPEHVSELSENGGVSHSHEQVDDG